MECLLEANPSPEVTWFQGNKVIADSSRVKMTRTPLGKDTFALALEILNPTKEDGGNYRCNACNAYGESNANIALNFQGTYCTSALYVGGFFRVIRVDVCKEILRLASAPPPLHSLLRLQFKNQWTVVITKGCL